MEIELFGLKFNFIYLVLILLLLGLMSFTTWCSCSGGVHEGFKNMLNVAEFSVTTLQNNIGNLKNNFDNNFDNKTPINKEKNLFGFFDKNKFSSDCCPSTYTNSLGCACINDEQYDFLNKRGGNRTLNSMY